MKKSCAEKNHSSDQCVWISFPFDSKDLNEGREGIIKAFREYLGLEEASIANEPQAEDEESDIPSEFPLLLRAKMERKQVNLTLRIDNISALAEAARELKDNFERFSNSRIVDDLIERYLDEYMESMRKLIV